MVNEQEIQEFQEKFIKWCKEQIWLRFADRENALVFPTKISNSPFQVFTPGHEWSEIVFWDGDKPSRLDSFVLDVFHASQYIENVVYLFCLEEAFTEIAQELPQPSANEINLSACFYALMNKTLLLADEFPSHSLEMKDWAIAMESEFAWEAKLE